MSYEELYAQAVKAGAVDQINVSIVKWTEEDQRVVGEFVRQEILADTKFEGEVQKYVLKTDDGLISFVLGAPSDKELADKLKPGVLMAVTFRGKKEIGDGKTVNVFTIQHFQRVKKDGKA